MNKIIKEIENEFKNALKSLGGYIVIFIGITGGLFKGLLGYELGKSVIYTTGLFFIVLIFVLIKKLVDFRKIFNFIRVRFKRLRIFKRLRFLEKENYELRMLLKQLTNPKEELKGDEEYNQHLNKLLYLRHDYGWFKEKIKKDRK